MITQKIKAPLTDLFGGRHGLVARVAHLLRDETRHLFTHDAFEEAVAALCLELLEEHQRSVPGIPDLSPHVESRPGLADRLCRHREPLQPLGRFLSPATGELRDTHGQQPPQPHAGLFEYNAAHCSRTRAHVYCSTSGRPRRAMRTARSGSSSRLVTALTIAAGSSGGTRKPVSPSRTRLAISPVPVDTTGNPEAKASSTETGWLSTTDELTKISASP